MLKVLVCICLIPKVHKVSSTSNFTLKILILWIIWIYLSDNYLMDKTEIEKPNLSLKPINFVFKAFGRNW